MLDINDLYLSIKCPGCFWRKNNVGQSAGLFYRQPSDELRRDIKKYIRKYAKQPSRLPLFIRKHYGQKVQVDSLRKLDKFNDPGRMGWLKLEDEIYNVDFYTKLEEALIIGNERIPITHIIGTTDLVVDEFNYYMHVLSCYALRFTRYTHMDMVRGSVFIWDEKNLDFDERGEHVKIVDLPIKIEVIPKILRMAGEILSGKCPPHNLLCDCYSKD